MSETAFDAKSFCSSLPLQPGIYRMLNRAGEVIYVGKAIDLKKRVSSYFQKTSLAPRTQLMVSKIASIEITITRSEAEALLLENNLIKSLKPRYNILFKDDKSYPYLMLSKHSYPRLGFHRGMLDKQHQYFGPYPNAGIVRESVQLLQKIFRIRTCEDSVFNHRTRPCLLYQIKRCSGPCVNLITQRAYLEDIRNTELFLQGKQTEVVNNLIEKMQRASDRMEYEQAALFRDQIQSLRKIREKQVIDSGKALDADVIACATLEDSNGKICVNLAMIRGGRHLGDKSFFPQNAEGHNPATIVEAFLAQHYLNRSVPHLIIIGEKIRKEALQTLLDSQAGHKVLISLNSIGERRAWLDMAAENARLALKQMINQQASQKERVRALQQALNLSNLTRIECFDISHTSGEATVASCVIYDNFSMRNNEYRRYNIDNITPGDDYAAMREALSRRYYKAIKDESRPPDLILIDGGKGQISVAQEALTELGLSNVNLLGVAKGEGRKPGLEQLIFPVTKAKKPLQLMSDHAGLHLIQQIRDEAHRFAIQGHRNRRGKARTSSSLERISGIGVKRRQGLLSRFGGLKGVLTASIEELQQTEGISRKLAEKIYKELH
ncbi:Excinuclease ABC subunit C [Nitrosomonas cryotolerans]|uniref:UvrABC system protein C n=1 Tax=Nitrosomonas cryotolerans ATCC 49181 TaxID=1131553 RepID=A0A1N6IMX0_9PROT|nr:excinuclease ABC subunit UvrC [Nitrosomonas cryotolerans]SFP36283.1 Excinuclease ABC subunit C [Nitrosomonas cryotolerans]SIO33371.1 Excinuclease ABC subunit C [Nitrosomonas cryotolerans ATCC 49181]